MNETRMTLNPVLIVGGGISGLSAAKRLKKKGIPVLVLEGRDRLGGRIHTVDVAGDQTSWTDMGAAWIDDHLTNRVYHLLNDVGAEFDPTVLSLFGQRIFDHQSARWKGWGSAAWTMAKFGWRSRKLQASSSEFASLGERISALLGEQPKREMAWGKPWQKSVLNVLAIWGLSMCGSPPMQNRISPIFCMNL